MKNHGACALCSPLNSLRNWSYTLRASSMSVELSGCTSPSSWVFRKLKWKCGSRTEELGGENKCSALQWHHPSHKSANEVVLFTVESNRFVCCVTKVTPESDQRLDMLKIRDIPSKNPAMLPQKIFQLRVSKMLFSVQINAQENAVVSCLF